MHFIDKKVIKLVCRNTFKSNHPRLLSWDDSISVYHIAVTKDQVRVEGGVGVKDDFGSQPLTPQFSPSRKTLPNARQHLKHGSTPVRMSECSELSRSATAKDNLLRETPPTLLPTHQSLTQTSQLLNFTFSSRSASNFADL